MSDGNVAGSEHHTSEQSPDADVLSLSNGDSLSQANDEDMLPEPDVGAYAVLAEGTASIGEVKLPHTCTLLATPTGARVYLIGTAHFSVESQNDVSQVIQTVKPDVVMIELCAARRNMLSLDEERLLEEAKNISIAKVKQAIQQSGAMQGIMYILLLSMSAHITKQLGMAPGGEFRRAYNEACKIPGCQVLFGDRPIQITLQRALGSLTFFHKLKLAWHLLTSNDPISKEDVEKCKQKDLLEELLREMTGEFPMLSRVFVDERDVFLTNSLRAAAHLQHSAHSPPVVVGVVGIGHVSGIIKNWNQPLDIASIMSVPPPSKLGKAVKYCVRASLLCVGVYGIYRLGRRLVR